MCVFVDRTEPWESNRGFHVLNQPVRTSSLHKTASDIWIPEAAQSVGIKSRESWRRKRTFAVADVLVGVPSDERIRRVVVHNNIRPV